MDRHSLNFGEAARWFSARTHSVEKFKFDTVGGRHVVLSFFGSAADPGVAEFLRAVRAHGGRFDDARASFFGVSTDPEDERAGRIAEAIPGVRFFLDFDSAVSKLYGVVEPGGYRRVTYVFDPLLRVMATIKFGDGAAHAATLFNVLDQLPMPPAASPAHPQAPVLVLPRIFEKDLCRRLIAYYEERGGEDSGYMQDIEGKTTLVVNHRHKRRRDCSIEDAALRQHCMDRVVQRLVPELMRAFQFNATRVERHIVACYDAEERGHFRAHRDNTTKGTAHRRFAVSLFLNSGEYEGGFLRFPEFGASLYTAPAGGAVVFSCSLLHEALAVTRGRRYMYLPFLYDEDARRVRENNLRFVTEDARAQQENTAATPDMDTFNFSSR